MVMITFAQVLFCLLGMQIFGNTIEGYQDGLRSNFDSFWQSNLTLFQCLSGENWTDVMYGYMAVYPSVSPLFFILWTLIGNYILLNLFIAVITENIEADTSGLEAKQAEEYRQEVARERRLNGKEILTTTLSQEREIEICQHIVDLKHSSVKVDHHFWRFLLLTLFSTLIQMEG